MQPLKRNVVLNEDHAIRREMHSEAGLQQVRQASTDSNIRTASHARDNIILPIKIVSGEVDVSSAHLFESSAGADFSPVFHRCAVHDDGANIKTVVIRERDFRQKGLDGLARMPLRRSQVASPAGRLKHEFEAALRVVLNDVEEEVGIRGAIVELILQKKHEVNVALGISDNATALAVVMTQHPRQVPSTHRFLRIRVPSELQVNVALRSFIFRNHGVRVPLPALARLFCHDTRRG